MIMKRIDNVDIKVLNGEMDDREIKNYKIGRAHV